MWPSTTAARAFFTTLCGSADEANSRTDVPWGTLFSEPSGRVMVIWDMKRSCYEKSFDSGFGLAQDIRLARMTGPAMSEPIEAGESNGRHGRTRTADLLHVKQAL